MLYMCLRCLLELDIRPGKKVLSITKLISQNSRACQDFGPTVRPLGYRLFFCRAQQRTCVNFFLIHTNRGDDLDDKHSSNLRPTRRARIMASEKEIGAPFTLASLPTAISACDGRTHAASVCSISGTKKRKRTEIAVGLDGEGVSIYSVGGALYT